MLAVAVLVGKARIAEAEQRGGDAIALLTEAAAKEDGLAYDEPVGLVLSGAPPARRRIAEGRQGAGRGSRVPEDLRRHPENGWALYGLAQALAAQHKDAEALAVRQRFDKAWKSADVTLTASAF